ncbi:MAG TPA: hypothetical protein VIY48_22025 [Candidatus Paceibacterota bacterium]|jgi:hypothetical protein
MSDPNAGGTATAAPAADTTPKKATGTLTLTAPDGGRFEMEEVKGVKGTVSLGDVPILIWEDLEKSRSYYGDEALLNILDGTSLRVSFQGIARRMAAAGKAMDEIAKAQIDFRPGKRQVGASTPVSRAGNAARKAAEKLGDSESLNKILEAVAAGNLTQAQLDKLAAQLG